MTTTITRTENAPRPAEAGRGASLAQPSRDSGTQVSRLSSGQLAARGALIMVVVVCAAILLNLAGFSHIHHAVSQQQLMTTFGEELAAGTAPVSEGTFDNVLVQDGEPVARIQIPALRVDEVIVEGTSSTAMRLGPGHRRDTVLPGQRGTSIVMGRAAAYGGPFGRIGRLKAGDEIKVLTGQGEMVFKVVGARYAGDATPPLKKGGARIQLLSAVGAPLMPSRIVRVDADLVSEAQDTGLRQTGFLALPAKDQPMASDTTTVWALVFALEFLLLAEVGFLWAWRHLGRAKAWAIGVPVLLLAAVFVGDQIARLLPNLT